MSVTPHGEIERLACPRGDRKRRGTKAAVPRHFLSPLGISRGTLNLTVLEDEFRMVADDQVASRALVGRKIKCRALVATACDIDRLEHSSGRLRRLKALFSSGLESS
jgi:hypothetical protein